MLNLNDVSENEVGIFLNASQDNWIINNRGKNEPSERNFS